MLFIIKTVSKNLLILFATSLIVCLAAKDIIASGSISKLAIVTTAYLNIRHAPDNTSKIVQTVRKDSLLTIVKHTKNGWLQIYFQGNSGYIRNRQRYVKVFKKKTKNIVKRKLSVTPYSVSSNVEKKIEERTQEKKTVELKIVKTKDEVKTFSKKENVIIKGLNEIDISLNNSRKKLSNTKKDIQLLDAEIRNNKNAINDLKFVIRKNSIYIEKRLVSLYKLYQLGHLNVLASADSVYDFLSRKNGMENILEADEKILKNHHENVKRLTNLQNRLSEQKGAKLALKNNQNKQIHTIELKKTKKNSLLKEIRNKKTLKLAAIASLQDAARELAQTIASLDQGFNRTIDISYNKKIFIERKGLMRLPAKGDIINHFGKSKDDTFKIETFHSGIKILADRGEPVQSIGKGTVIFADWLKGYGNLIILDHGDHYYSLYGHTEELFKQKGDTVQNREVIATVGDTGSLDGAGLHFEIRHNGQPVAPLNWLKKDKY